MSVEEVPWILMTLVLPMCSESSPTIVWCVQAYDDKHKNITCYTMCNASNTSIFWDIYMGHMICIDGALLDMDQCGFT